VSRTWCAAAGREPDPRLSPPPRIAYPALLAVSRVKAKGMR
jgi:hypothetical protein